MPPGPFDFAIVMGVMDYVAEPVAFLKGLRKMSPARPPSRFPATIGYARRSARYATPAELPGLFLR